MLDTRFVRSVRRGRGSRLPRPSPDQDSAIRRFSWSAVPLRLLRTALAAFQPRYVERTGIVLLTAAALSLGAGSGTSVASTSSRTSLRYFCIDCQDYGSYNPTGVAEWKFALGSVKDLVKEAPTPSVWYRGHRTLFSASNLLTNDTRPFFSLFESALALPPLSMMIFRKPSSDFRSPFIDAVYLLS